MTQTVAFYTLGCKLNFSETSTIAREFQQIGYQRLDWEQPADIYVINTCSVTDNADKRFKDIVKQAYKSNPNAFVIAIGCYAQLKPEELAQVENVDLVLGTKEKFNITHYLQELKKSNVATVHSCEINEVNHYESAYSIGDRTRAFLKIQDGCDYVCTYCTIPMARGVSRSDTLQNVIQNAITIATKGIQEIVLTGVNIGDYGKGELGDKFHEHTFFDLVQALDKIENIQRFRISSIEPNLLKDDIIQWVAVSQKFVPHFHIPLQSGSDEILKKMKRRYLRDLYVEKVQKIKSIMPDACIGVDVIVGFPGETDELFLETYHFLNELDISYLHVFTYSERPNTEAVTFSEIVPQQVRYKRSKMLRGLSVKKRRLFYESQLGKYKTVLLEAENKDGFMFGFTENYVKVKTPFNASLINTTHKVILTRIDQDGLVLFDFVS